MCIVNLLMEHKRLFVTQRLEKVGTLPNFSWSMGLQTITAPVTAVTQASPLGLGLTAARSSYTVSCWQPQILLCPTSLLKR